ERSVRCRTVSVLRLSFLNFFFMAKLLWTASLSSLYGSAIPTLEHEIACSGSAGEQEQTVPRGLDRGRGGEEGEADAGGAAQKSGIGEAGGAAGRTAARGS